MSIENNAGYALYPRLYPQCSWTLVSYILKESPLLSGTARDVVCLPAVLLTTV